MSEFLNDPIWDHPVLKEMREHWRQLCREKDLAANVSAQAYEEAQCKERSWACMMWATYREIRREQQTNLLNPVLGEPDREIDDTPIIPSGSMRT
jgi:hypothetical protein